MAFRKLVAGFPTLVSEPFSWPFASWSQAFQPEFLSRFHGLSQAGRRLSSLSF
jgi:hypothetical protein